MAKPKTTIDKSRVHIPALRDVIGSLVVLELQRRGLYANQEEATANAGAALAEIIAWGETEGLWKEDDIMPF